MTGRLALAEALRGRLGRAADLAAEAASIASEHRLPDPGPTPLVARAWVHLARHELRDARSCLKHADAALGVSPDKLVGAAAYLVAAGGALAEGRPAVAAQIIARARSGWSVPSWLDRQLSLVESRAQAADGDTEAVHRTLAPALAANGQVPDLVRLQALLVDARLGYASGADGRGRRSLASALRLAEREQVRLPFALERGWLGTVLRRDPELADSHRSLLVRVPGLDQLPAPVNAAGRAPVLLIEPLTDREREVLVHVSGTLNTAAVAEEMYISVNTVKTHLRNIYRKLAAEHRAEAVRRARQLQLI